MWIFSSRETGSNPSKLLSPDPQYLFHNWTISFGSDSDFPVPYGRYKEDVAEVPLNDKRNWAMGKTRLVAWIASNCNKTSWERTHFVKNLTNLIQVDTYGACGTHDCPRGTTKCWDIVYSYKFYLALENSECDDYITEKFWIQALQHNSVPIVYGTTRKDYEKVAPPNSFIHLSDFGSMTSLADRIKYLDKNDTAYNEYFNWKKRGSVEFFSEDDVPSTTELCAIVRKLKEIDEMKKTAKGRSLQIVSKVEEWVKCHHLPSPWTSVVK
ncbi:Glycoprotein 3-alpha-L-fucosyltransferase A [Holothuria leucospilota]|uniref:Fucosyltransferase n=1 Tax=Holothuria leucospilota TaxID=206669 RepID=A0A9Q1H9I7_HOLLE|nr:Glycoprotein 3-alpha-L-fucosyltransferase A [Holothuria leucospilota]